MKKNLLSGGDLLSISNKEKFSGMQLLFSGMTAGGAIKGASSCCNLVIQPERRGIILEIVMQRKNEGLWALDEASDP